MEWAVTQCSQLKQLTTKNGEAAIPGKTMIQDPSGDPDEQERAREHASRTTCPTVALACRSPASTAAAGRVCSWSSARVFGLVTALRLMLYNG